MGPDSGGLETDPSIKVHSRNDGLVGESSPFCRYACILLLGYHRMSKLILSIGRSADQASRTIMMWLCLHCLLSVTALQEERQACTSPFKTTVSVRHEKAAERHRLVRPSDQ